MKWLFNRRGIGAKTQLLFLVAACFAILTGCTPSPINAAANAAGGQAGTISNEVVDNEPRPPKQIVFRFDDHRYIESDPSGGFVGGCQGELYYVDEKLGIRTKYGGNKQRNPSGLFKVDSPYVVVRDEYVVRVSFDQGRTFPVHFQVSEGADIVVSGSDFYMGGGGNVGQPFHDSYGIWVGSINAQTRAVDELVAADGVTDKGRARGAPYFPIVQKLRPVQPFQCKDLPWRKSSRQERTLEKSGAAGAGSHE